MFISYAHEDKPLARAVVAALRQNGLRPMWDEQLPSGGIFDRLIRTFIMHADVFLPLITPAASQRGWVHQEIGFATAHRIPVLPVCRGRLPVGMIERAQAVQLGPKDGDLRNRLPWSTFERLVQDAELDPPLFECAFHASDRARMLAGYARRIRDLDGYGLVRQRGGLSSFNLPDKSVDHAIWRQRYGAATRSEEQIGLLREERLALEDHARAVGCKLVIDSGIHYEQLGPEVRAIRIRTLIEFLETMPANKVRIAFTHTNSPESLTLVGDWYLAESVKGTAMKGYQQTIFTRHAPSVRKRVAEFDGRFEELLHDPMNAHGGTLAGAVAHLKRILRGSRPARPRARR